MFLPLGTKGMAEPRTSLSRAQRIPSGFVISIDIAGANPLVPGAPDIDLHAMLKFTHGQGGLHVEGSLRGDAFPNAEIFLSDDVGTARMRPSLPAPARTRDPSSSCSATSSGG